MTDYHDRNRFTDPSYSWMSGNIFNDDYYRRNSSSTDFTRSNSNDYYRRNSSSSDFTPSNNNDLFGNRNNDGKKVKWSEANIWQKTASVIIISMMIAVWGFILSEPIYKYIIQPIIHFISAF